MRQLLYLTYMAILLVCVSGCAKQGEIPQASPPQVEFEVDGVKYGVVCYAHCTLSGQITESILIIGDTRLAHDTGFGRTIVRINTDGKETIAEMDTLYFVHEGKIVFEKKYQELDIDASRFLNAGLNELLEDLRPILEQLIRENVIPNAEKEQE